jgi:hypothetical protein
VPPSSQKPEVLNLTPHHHDLGKAMANLSCFHGVHNSRNVIINATYSLYPFSIMTILLTKIQPLQATATAFPRHPNLHLPSPPR